MYTVSFLRSVRVSGHSTVAGGWRADEIGLVGAAMLGYRASTRSERWAEGHDGCPPVWVMSGSRRLRSYGGHGTAMALGGEGFDFVSHG